MIAPSSATRVVAPHAYIFYGPIMVQQLFLTALNAFQGAIRVSWFQLVTSKWGAVTALLVIFGNARAQKGASGNK
jgi:hypothetical protein